MTTALTAQRLAAALACPLTRASAWAPHLNAACTRYGIDTPAHVAHFLAQISVESAALSRLEESLLYTAGRLVAVWPSRFKSIADARPFARNPEAFANKVYGGRMGNDLPGDGWNFRGRGLKQLTGRSNYVAYMLDSGLDCVTDPDLILMSEHAADSAAWCWKTNACNRLADSGDVRALTLKINGGLTGCAARLDATRRALAALKA